MAKLPLPKAPEAIVEWGTIQQDCKKDFKFWIEQMIVIATIHPNHMNEIVNSIYDELVQLGYEEGQQDCSINQIPDPEGW